MECPENPEERGARLLALRAVAEVDCGLATATAEASLSRGLLNRALSPKGNPALKTLIAVLKTVGLRLSVTDAQREPAEQEKMEDDFVAA